MERDIAILLEAVRAARSELDGLRDPQRNTTSERAIRRLSMMLESREVEDALARLTTEDSPSIAPSDPVDLRAIEHRHAMIGPPRPR